MFLRCHARKKNGKLHRYWSVVESRRLADGQSAQRQLLYLGEINDSQQAAWRKSIEVFDEDKQQLGQAALFPDDAPIPEDQLNAPSLVTSDIRLLRPRSFGDCWLGCQLWRELEPDRFWQQHLEDQRGGVPWEKVLQLLAINRPCQPASEWAVHRRWFLNSAADQLLDCDFAIAEKDRPYRCLDRVLAHKDALCQHLVRRWKTLFDARFDILLYDLTSTYFEGQSEQIPKARHGYSRDGRGDCRQVVIALVVTTDGLPLAYEVLSGNRTDKTTLGSFLARIQSMYGQARRVWIMDRGIPTEATLKQMRADRVAYLVGTPRTMPDKLEKELADKPWEQVHEGMKVKLPEQDGELYIQAASDARRNKENAMRRRLKKLARGLNRIRRGFKRRAIARDQVLRRVAVLRKEAGRVSRFLKIREPAIGEPQHLHRHAGQGGVEAGDAPRWPLHPSCQHPLGTVAGGDAKAGAGLVEMVHATGPGGGGVQDAQGRAEPSADSSSTAKPRGGAHPGGVPGLLPEQQPADETVIGGPGPHAPRRVGIAFVDSNAGGADPDKRWPGAGDAALYRTGGPAEDDPGGVEADAAAPASAAYPGRQNPTVRRAARCAFVVQTYGVKTPFLIQK